jgi:hypothetical protein
MCALRRRKGGAASSLSVALNIVSSCFIVGLGAASRFILAARVRVDITIRAALSSGQKDMLHRNGMLLALRENCIGPHKRR